MSTGSHGPHPAVICTIYKKQSSLILIYIRRLYRRDTMNDQYDQNSQ